MSRNGQMAEGQNYYKQLIHIKTLHSKRSAVVTERFVLGVSPILTLII